MDSENQNKNEINSSFEDKAQSLYKKRFKSKINKEIHPYSLWAFILATFPIWGVFFLFYPFLNIIFFFIFIIGLIISIILATLSFSKIKNNPNKYWGNGFSILSIILSIIELLIIIFIGYFFFVIYQI